MKYSVYPMVDYHYRMKVFVTVTKLPLKAKSLELKNEFLMRENSVSFTLISFEGSNFV